MEIDRSSAAIAVREFLDTPNDGKWEKMNRVLSELGLQFDGKKRKATYTGFLLEGTGRTITIGHNNFEAMRNIRTLLSMDIAIGGIEEDGRKSCILDMWTKPL